MPLLPLLVLFACGGPADPPAAPPAPSPSPAPVEEGPLVIFLGDSLSAGLGLPADQAFPALLDARLDAEGLPARVINAGVSGDTSAGGLARLDWLLSQGPDVLVVELGGNDLLRGQTPEATADNLRGIVRGARAAGVQVVLVGMTAPVTHGPEFKAAFDAIYPTLAEQEGATLVPGFIDGLMGRPELLQADGLHPTAEGHRLLADALAPALFEAVRARGR